MNKISTIKVISSVLMLWASPLVTGWSAQIDLGYTLGEVRGATGILTGTEVRLGTFTGYTDLDGFNFFSGKDYNALSNAFVSLTNSDNSTKTDSIGGYFGSWEGTSTTPSLGTRVFAWFFDSATASALAKWAIISGTIAGTDDYSPNWIAPAPGDTNIPNIEAGTIYSNIFARSEAGVIFLANNTIDKSGANLIIPEPSTASLIAVGAMGLIVLRARRKS